jgi:hypothetical protein
MIQYLVNMGVVAWIDDDLIIICFIASSDAF